LDRVVAIGDYTEEQVLRLAATVERASEHPLAEAIVNAAKQRNLRLEMVTRFESVTGAGVRAVIGRSSVLVGSRRLLDDAGVNALELDRLRETDDGAAVYVALDGRPAGLILVSDPIKASAATAIATLKRMKLSVVMLTGDEERTARAVAARAGIDRVIAGVLPAGKVAAIRELQAAGAVVAMVGDGINDAPALAQADIGIAIGTGTDIAIEAADLTLMRGDLAGVAQSIQLARRTMRIMKQNLFWAFIYNVIGIPVAAGVLYPLIGLLLSPILASAAMAMSSVSVVSNSLRLRRFAPAARERAATA
jgi:P-type Cu+ transporter